MSTRFVFPAFVVLALCSCRNDAAPHVTAPAPVPVPAVTPSSAAADPAAASASASTSVAPPLPARAWPPPPPAVTSDFCIEGVAALDEETCYVLPSAPPRELLIYFHGIVPPEKTSRQKTNLETALKNSAERAGVAVLLPRGEQGLAPRGHTGWWGWPTSGEAYAKWTPRLLEKVATKRRKLEEVVGAPFERSYVAGSSSGAYFTIALALNGDIQADGFGAISGAADRARDFGQVPPKPFYIGYGTRDTVGAPAQSLGARLERAGWPVKVSAHPLPHGTAEIYIDEAITFWRSAR